MSNSEITLVVFRVWTDKLSRYRQINTFALFPTIHADNCGDCCSSYMTIGQHSSADYRYCINQSRPATPEEYVDLKTELECIGYTLQVIQRATRKHHKLRRAIAALPVGAAKDTAKGAT